MHLSAVARPTFVQTVLPGSGILREILMVLGFSLIVALTAQVSIQLPFTPVPISGQTFGVLLAGAALGSVRGSASLLSYVGLGAVGLPVLRAPADRLPMATLPASCWRPLWWAGWQNGGGTAVSPVA
jgi:biotin transport system substrate-specific component